MILRLLKYWAPIVVPWSMLAGFAAVYMLNGWRLPVALEGGDPDEWFNVTKLQVFYNPQQESPIWVCATSEISHPFESSWRTTLRRIDPETGTALFVENAEADRPYDYAVRPRDDFCENWEKYTNMALPTVPGIYRLTVVWPMVDDEGFRRTQRISSNLFRVD